MRIRLTGRHSVARHFCPQTFLSEPRFPCLSASYFSTVISLFFVAACYNLANCCWYCWKLHLTMLSLVCQDGFFYQQRCPWWGNSSLCQKRHFLKTFKSDRIWRKFLHAMFVEINLKLVFAIFLKFIIHLIYILYNNLDEIAIANNDYLC